MLEKNSFLPKEKCFILSQKTPWEFLVLLILFDCSGVSSCLGQVCFNRTLKVNSTFCFVTKCLYFKWLWIKTFWVGFFDYSSRKIFTFFLVLDLHNTTFWKAAAWQYLLDSILKLIHSCLIGIIVLSIYELTLLLSSWNLAVRNMP